MKTIKIILFYIISFTWGILMTLFGCLCALGLLITGHKPKLFHQNIYFEVGTGWGGFEAGCFFFCCKDHDLHLMQHESGHGLQNLVLGPLMLFIVSIPSCIRYWLRECKTLKSKHIFSAIISICLIGLSLITLLINISLNSLLMIIIGSLLLIYCVIIFNWLTFKELPQYTVEFQPDYDDIWFEGNASKLGAKVYPK